MRYDRIAPLFFLKNRERFVEALPKGCVAIIHAQSSVLRSADVPYTFRQNSSFFYLCGSEDADSVFVVFKTIQGTTQQVLFVKKPNTFDQVWYGQVADLAYIRSSTAIDTILFLEELYDYLASRISGIHTVYSNIEDPSLRISKEILPKTESIRSLLEGGICLDVSSLLNPLRMLKGPLEEALIRRAIRITGEAFADLLPQIKEGQKEYEIEAILSSSILRRQANGFSFPPIIASGKNSCYLHYEAANTRLKAGDILLLDIGAEYANYAADICRVVPVSGCFTERQKEIYRAVQKVLNGAIDSLVPGLFWTEYEHIVGAMMTEVLLDLGLLTSADVEDENPSYPAYKRYFMHGISHHIGLDVHDGSDRFVAFEKGNILTVEPGIYIPEEDLGIRLEQMVAIREGGAEILSKDISIELEDIEALMSGK